jgi:hypothetical protein
MIPKGTTVRVRTTNGGDIIGQLYERYRPTYDVVIDQWSLRHHHHLAAEIGRAAICCAKTYHGEVLINRTSEGGAMNIKFTALAAYCWRQGRRWRLISALFA